MDESKPEAKPAGFLNGSHGRLKKWSVHYVLLYRMHTRAWDLVGSTHFHGFVREKFETDSKFTRALFAIDFTCFPSSNYRRQVASPSLKHLSNR